MAYNSPVPNVDREVHNPEVTNGNLIKERTTSKAKRSLRGAAGGIYIGPVLSVAAIGDAEDGSSYASAASSHATTANGGGLDGSTGYRKSDTYYVDGDATGGGMGAGGTLTARPNPGGATYGGRRLYRGDGVAGGSIVGYPAQRSGQRSTAAGASSEYGKTADGNAGAFIDKRSDASDGSALGSSGRGSRVINGTVSRSAARKANLHRFPVPVLSGDDPAASGAIQLVDGTGGAVHADLHADDITAGANDWAGCVIYAFSRGTDTDEDAKLVRKGDFDTVTEGAVTGLTGMTAGTYAFYAAFKDAEGNIGPWSNRFALAIT